MLARARIPDLRGGVVAGRYEHRAVRAERYRAHRFMVPYEGEQVRS